MRSAKRVAVSFGGTEVGVGVKLLHTPTIDLAAHRTRERARLDRGGQIDMLSILDGLRADNSMSPETIDFLLKVGGRFPYLTWTQLLATLDVMLHLAYNRDAVLPVPF